MGGLLSIARRRLLVSGGIWGKWHLAWLGPLLGLQVYHVAPLGLLLWDGVSGGLRLQLHHVAASRLRWGKPHPTDSC